MYHKVYSQHNQLIGEGGGGKEQSMGQSLQGQQHKSGLTRIYK